MKTPRYPCRVSYYNAAQGGRRTESHHRYLRRARAAAKKLNSRISGDGYSHSYRVEYFDEEEGWMPV